MSRKHYTTCTHTCMYKHSHTHTHTHTHACTHTHMQTRIHTCTHTHIHTHAHTQIWYRAYINCPGTSGRHIQCSYGNLNFLFPLELSRHPQCGGVPLPAVATSWPPLHPSLPPANGGGREVSAQRHRTYTGHVRVSGWALLQCQHNGQWALTSLLSFTSTSSPSCPAPTVTACPALECSSPPWLKLKGSKCRGRWTSSRLSRQLALRGLTWCPLQ